MKTTYIVKNNFAPTTEKKKQKSTTGKKYLEEVGEELSEKVLRLKEAYIKAIGDKK